MAFIKFDIFSMKKNYETFSLSLQKIDCFLNIKLFKPVGCSALFSSSRSKLHFHKIQIPPRFPSNASLRKNVVDLVLANINCELTLATNVIKAKLDKVQLCKIVDHASILLAQYYDYLSVFPKRKQIPHLSVFFLIMSSI